MAPVSSGLAAWVLKAPLSFLATLIYKMGCYFSEQDGFNIYVLGV